MQLPDDRVVQVDGVGYQVKAWLEGEWVLVRAFRAEEPVGLLYGVGSSERQDFELLRGGSAVEELMNLAESDLTNGESEG
jgi:hypothetical protein